MQPSQALSHTISYDPPVAYKRQAATIRSRRNAGTVVASLGLGNMMLAMMRYEPPCWVASHDDDVHSLSPISEARRSSNSHVSGQSS